MPRGVSPQYSVLASRRFRAGRQTDHLEAPALARSGCLSRPQSKEALFQRGDVCCSRQQTGDFCADPFLRFRQCGSCQPQFISFCGRVGRIASRARQGGRTEEKENFESNGCARRAHVVRSSALGRRPTRGGESARTRWSCGGSARPLNFQDRRCTGLFEQQVPVKSVFAQTR